MFGKQGKNGIDWPVVLLAVLVVWIVLPDATKLNIQNGVSGLLGQSTTPPPVAGGATVTPAATGCVDPTVKTTMTLDAEDAYAPATRPGGDNRVWLNGADQGLVANSNSITVSPGDAYVILWAENSTSYYGKVTKGTVPCSGTLRLKEKLYAWVDSKASDTLFNVYNEQGQVGDAKEAASGTYYNITLGAGDLETVNFEVKGVYKKAMGNPELAGESMIACKYNQTAYDDVLMSLSKVGFTNKEVDCPNLATAAASYTWACFAAPSVVSNEKISGSLTIDVDDTYAPSSDSEDIKCFMYDTDYDIHSITNAIISGVEDDLDTGLGHTGNSDWNFTFHAT